MISSVVRVPAIIDVEPSEEIGGYIPVQSAIDSMDALKAEVMAPKEPVQEERRPVVIVEAPVPPVTSEGIVTQDSNALSPTLRALGVKPNLVEPTPSSLVEAEPSPSSIVDKVEQVATQVVEASEVEQVATQVVEAPEVEQVAPQVVEAPEVEPDQDLDSDHDLYNCFDWSSLVFDFDPSLPTDAKPGSEDKVRVLEARYASGLPLWHDEDRYDHGDRDLVTDEFGF